VYQPAKPHQLLGVVLRQYPAKGTLSSYQKVTLVLPKALQGIVPNVVGLRFARAKARLGRFHLKWKVDGNPPGSAIVTWQSPRGHTAAAKGLVVRLAAK
jgi:PASTA domain